MEIKKATLFVWLLCAARAEYCADNTCHRRGHCYETAEQAVCVCQAGYTGTRCQYEKVTCSAQDPCTKGTCVTDHCVCLPGYAGPYCEFTDYCRENPCRDHGKCLSLEEDFQCLCDKGYNSRNCETDIDECSVNPGICQNGGVCKNTAGSFQCQCPAGYNGQLCGFNINECESDPCLNGGRCIDEVSDFRCECPLAFSGGRCEIEATDCGCVHGTCTDDSNGSCVCDLGWTGYKCTEKINTCADNPCQNGTHPNQVSTCKQYFINGVDSRIHCVCGPGLQGNYCEEEFNMCNQNPCRGNGNCTSVPGGTYACDCYKGFTDHNCETDINECRDFDPCNNGGKCTNTIGSYYCECRQGFGGMNCELDIDECAGEPCQNKGSCVDLENSYECNCQDGYTGRNCEEEIDECETNSCPEYSICVDKVNHYRCICQDGFEGREGCEIDEDQCTANLCKNGGACIDLPGDFRCECRFGYSGETCQFDNTACGRKPCVHGDCYLFNEQDIGDHYCVCQPGFTGGDCSIDINECQPDPCQNAATCVDQPNDFFCECPAEFTGKSCDLDARHCANNPCAHGGTCATSSDTPFYTCNCKPGYQGNKCGDEVLCERELCGNRGKCITLTEDDFRCDCDDGFTGPTCNTEIVACGKLQCHNGGTCNSLRNKCDCGPGYSGPECRNRATTCSDRPCVNGASCIPGLRGMFECACGPGYEGQYCEVQLSSPCSAAPCANGGTCSPNENSYTCSCMEGWSGARCQTRDFCLPDPCNEGYTCENFPKRDPMQYMCCEESRAICYSADGCAEQCEALKNDNICQSECYSEACHADAADCSQKRVGSSQDPWDICPSSECRTLFNNRICNRKCNNAACNFDGMDCVDDRVEQTCEYESYCKTYYNNNLCDQGCNNSACSWDGQDCLQRQEHQEKEGIRMTVNVNCEKVRQFRSQLTNTLDTWSRAISVVESIESNVEPDRCDLVLTFDDRYCGATCRTSNMTELKNYLWANLLSNGSTSHFPFRVIAISDAHSQDRHTISQQTVSTTIIVVIAVIGLLLLVAAVMVGRNVIRARARLWEPDGFKTQRKIKRNIKDISKMGDPVHLKTLPKLADPYCFTQFAPEQTHIMDVDLEPMYIMNRSHVAYDQHDEAAPMITQAAYEYRQRDETASPTTQAEEQVAVGRPSVRVGLGRGETQLHAVCRNKKVEDLKKILALGNLDINVTDSMGRTPLYSAVGSDAIEIVDILLDIEGIDVDKPMAEKEKGATPLILATKMVYNFIVEKLLQSRAQVNAVDSYGRSALHWAAAVSNLHAMELLLKHGANKDAESVKKETPLFLAAREGKLEAVKILVCHNAQRHLANSMDETPIEVARNHLHHDIEEVLLTWNTDGTTVIKSQNSHLQAHPGSLTPPQSDDAATGSPNSLPTLSPCEKDQSDREEKKGSKRKKKKTEAGQPSHPQVYQTGYWAKNQIHSPPNWMSTQMLSPESLTGSPTSTSLPTTVDQGVQKETHQPRLSHYPAHPPHPAYPSLEGSYIPHDHLLPHRQPNRQYPHHPGHQLDYHSSPDSPEETWQQITSPPNSDWSHTSP